MISSGRAAGARTRTGTATGLAPKAVVKSIDKIHDGHMKFIGTIFVTWIYLSSKRCNKSSKIKFMLRFYG